MDAKSPEEEQIVAMSAELWKIKDDNLCFTNGIKKKGSPSNKTKNPVEKTKPRRPKPRVRNVPTPRSTLGRRSLQKMVRH